MLWERNETKVAFNSCDIPRLVTIGQNWSAFSSPWGNTYVFIDLRKSWTILKICWKSPLRGRKVRGNSLSTKMIRCSRIVRVSFKGDWTSFKRAASYTRVDSNRISEMVRRWRFCPQSPKKLPFAPDLFFRHPVALRAKVQLFLLHVEQDGNVDVDRGIGEVLARVQGAQGSIR